MPPYPSEIAIEPWTGPPARASVHVPGSKSLTNRALIVAAMASGSSTLSGVLDSDDTRIMIQALRSLGVAVEHDPAAAEARTQGCGGRTPERQATLPRGNSGTSLRFLTAMLATGDGTYHLDGTPRMRERPVLDLLTALAGL